MVLKNLHPTNHNKDIELEEEQKEEEAIPEIEEQSRQQSITINQVF